MVSMVAYGYGYGYGDVVAAAAVRRALLILWSC